MSLAEDVYLIADQLRAIANLGLMVGESPYDKERYQRVLGASARMVAVVERRAPEEVLAQFEDNLDHISPGAAASAAVFRAGRLLLIRRERDGLWALPGGLAEVGETLAESAQRELLEEAGLEGRATRLLGIWDSRLVGSRSKLHFYYAVFLVESADGEPRPALPETDDVGFFPEDGLPELATGYGAQMPLLFKLYRGEVVGPYFDSPDAPGAQPA